MSFGLPTHLARSANNRSIAKASQWGGLVCLAAGLAMVLLSAATGAGTHFGAGLWPTVIALVPMMALLVILRRMRTVLMTVVYLIVGTLGTLLYTLTLLTRSTLFHDTQLFIVALPVIAMIVVGGAGPGGWAGVLWSSVGFALAEAAVFVAATIAGRVFSPDVSSLLVYALLVSVMILQSDFGAARHAPQAMIHRAVRDVQVGTVGHQLAVRFASDLHDGVLSDLIAIGSSAPGALSPRLRSGIERDLAGLGRDASGGFDHTGGPDHTGRSDHTDHADGSDNIGGSDYADGSSASRASDGSDRDPWQTSNVHLAVEQSMDDGLSVNVSGDTRLLASLTPEQDRELGRATRQCLVNVLRHAEINEADVAIAGGDGDVSVMVVDAGRGFVPDASSSSQLGLRTSVKERIHAAGGVVTIWSSPGVGTTVLMEIPVTDARDSPQSAGPHVAVGDDANEVDA